MRVSAATTKSTQACNVPSIDGDAVDTDEDMKTAEVGVGLPEAPAELVGTEEEPFPFMMIL